MNTDEWKLQEFLSVQHTRLSLANHVVLTFKCFGFFPGSASVTILRRRTHMASWDRVILIIYNVVFSSSFAIIYFFNIIIMIVIIIFPWLFSYFVLVFTVLYWIYICAFITNNKSNTFSKILTIVRQVNLYILHA